MSLIEIKNLKKTYGKEEISETQALRGVTFSVEAGEFVAIMGASGSGKSTLLHILGFLEKQSEGSYFYHGKDIDDYTEEDKARFRNQEFGFVFQAFHLLPRTTVLENVKLPLIYSTLPSREWNEEAKRVIDAVGLSHRLYHESSQLSGGEKQRVAIARALVNNPKVIFADEPTGNLDSNSGKVIMEMIQKLSSDSNCSVILVTHETYTANYAERIITIHDGRIISDAAVEKRFDAREGFRK